MYICLYENIHIYMYTYIYIYIYKWHVCLGSYILEQEESMDIRKNRGGKGMKLGS